MAYCLRKYSTHLKDLTWTELGVKQTRFEDVDWDDPASYVPYGAADSAYTFQHAVNFERELRAKGLWELYDEVERPAIPYIAQMEMNGILIDIEPVLELEELLHEELQATEARLAELYPFEVNWDSPPQRQNVLYGPPVWRVKVTGELKGRAVKGKDVVRNGAQSRIDYIPPGLGFRVQRRTKDTGAPETGIPALRLMVIGEENGQDVLHPLAEALIYRGSIEKMLTGDVVHFKDLRQEDGRIHTSLHQAGRWEETTSSNHNAPETSRLSSSAPNLQNITVHGDTERPYMVTWAQYLHRAQVAPPGWKIMKADVGQEEPRLGAILSGDEVYIDDMLHSDVYKQSAVLAFDKPFDEIDKEERQIGKRMHMAWLNRAGAHGIKKSAFWMTNPEAQDYVDASSERYETFTTWYENQIAFCRRHGYVETFYKWRVEFPGIWSKSQEDRAAAMRALVPGIIQGTGGGMMKKAITHVGRECRPEDSRLLLPVHDELVLEVREDALERLERAMASMVEGTIEGMDFPVEVRIGPNRAETIPADCYFGRCEHGCEAVRRPGGGTATA